MGVEGTLRQSARTIYKGRLWVRGRHREARIRQNLPSALQQSVARRLRRTTRANRRKNGMCGAMVSRWTCRSPVVKLKAEDCSQAIAPIASPASPVVKPSRQHLGIVDPEH